MRLRKTLARVGLVSVALAGAGLAAAPVATAAGTLGFAVITDSANTNLNKNSGGSQDQWQIRPYNTPSFCTGSSQTGYFVTGYITSEDPSTITFDAQGNPVTASGTTFSLFDAGTSPFIERNTAPPIPPSTQGQVQNSGPMSYSVFDTTTLPVGDYHVGLACVHVVSGTRTLDNFYDTRIHVALDASDPAGFSWQTVPNPQVPEFPMTAVLPISAGLVVAAGAFVLHRRRRSSVDVAV
jgi:hypothetical protein